MAGELGYSGGSAFQSFELNVGAFAGSAARLLLAVDDDADASGSATFRDIELLRDPFSVAMASHGGAQDKGVVREFLEGGTLKLTKNAWKSLDTRPLEIDANTVLHFDFRSDVAPEIAGIGFSASSALNANAFWQLLGSDTFGLQSANGAYSAGEGWESYEIAVGGIAPAVYDRVVLAADDDRANPVSDSYFREVWLTGLGTDDFQFQIL